MSDKLQIVTELDNARTALVNAKDDFERIQIRDQAKALEACAAVLKRKDIQVYAADIVRAAEEAMYDANPPKQGKRTDKLLDSESKSPPIDMAPIRKAYSKLDKEEVKKLREEAFEKQEPLTRKTLIEAGKAKQKEKKIERRQEIREQAKEKVKELPNNLFVCAVTELSRHVENESLDYIVTDPPYLTEYVEQGVYRQLGEFALHALKPAGVLLTIIPHLHIVRVIQEIGEFLNYRWIISYVETQARQKIHASKVTCQWKPWAVFKKGKLPDFYSCDLIHAGGYKSESNEKHHWGQHGKGIESVISEWCQVPGIVCDPFCGAGSTLKTAIKLGHKVIGSDIDAACVATTKEEIYGN